MEVEPRYSALALRDRAAALLQHQSFMRHGQLPTIVRLAENRNMNHDEPKITTIRGYNSTITFQHLRYALAAADHGSFRRAAESLLVRQSTLSRCIRQLEHSIGMTVFERSSGGVRATKSGRNFLSSARSILEQVASLVNSGRITGDGKAGQLAIGFNTSLSAGDLRETIVEHTKRLPQVEIDLFKSCQTRLISSLLKCDRHCDLNK